MADVTRDYTLSGAVFGAFGDQSGADTVSGTWSIDYSTMTVTALSLATTGAETINFDLASVTGLTSTGGGGATQYEIQLQSTAATPFYLDFQASGPVTLIANSYNGYQSNLYNLEYSYSGLTSAGVLNGAPYGAAVPEPAAWALMLIGVLGLGGALRRTRRTRGFATA